MAGTRKWVNQSGDLKDNPTLRQLARANLNPGQHRRAQNSAAPSLEQELNQLTRRSQPVSSPFLIDNTDSTDGERLLGEEAPLTAHLDQYLVREPIVAQESIGQAHKDSEASYLNEREKSAALPNPQEEEELLPLLRRAPNPPLLSRAWQVVVKNTKDVANQYRPFLNQLAENKFATFIAILASLTATVQAFANAYQTSTSKLSLDLIRSNSKNVLANAIVSAYSALHVNVPFNLSFLLAGRKKIMAALKTMIQKSSNFLGYGVLLLFALFAAAASAALTYATFLFLPIIVSIIQGLQSFLMNWTSRLTGLITAYQTLSNVFKHSARARRDIIDAFNHVDMDAEFELTVDDFEKEFGLSPADLGLPRDEAADLPNRSVKRSTRFILDAVKDKHVKAKLEKKREALKKELAELPNVPSQALDISQIDPKQSKESAKQLKESAKQLQESAKQLEATAAKVKKGIHLDDIDHERIFGELVKCLTVLDSLPKDAAHPFYRSRHWTEYATYYGHTLTQIVTGVIGGGVTAAIFAQNGFNAINYISQWTTGNNLSNLDVWVKRGMGFPAGIGPGTLYAISIALSLQHYVYTLPTFVWRHKSEFAPMFCLLVTLVTQYFASNSPRSIARNAVILPGNILGVLSQPGMQNTTETIMQAAGGMTNFAPTLRTLVRHFENPDKPTVPEILNHFADPNGHKTDDHTNDICIIAANKLSFFPPVTAPKAGGPIKKKPHSVRNAEGDRLPRDSSLGDLVSIGMSTPKAAKSSGCTIS